MKYDPDIHHRRSIRRNILDNQLKWDLDGDNPATTKI